MDDSVMSGGAMARALKKFEAAKKSIKYEFIFGVIYASHEGIDKVHFYCEEINEMRVFQWNLFHHGIIIPNSCFDIDGVLCPDPEVDDDGSLYIEFISTAPLLYKPSVEIDTIVTTRLEKYRDITETWLRKNEIRYKRLVMLDMATKAERIRWGKHGIFKGEVYRDSDCCLFVESSLRQANEIVRISHKPVFCTETFSMINDEQAVMKNNIRKKWREIKTFTKMLLIWKKI
jgi:uncharacterized HAD superfamily protein